MADIEKHISKIVFVGSELKQALKAADLRKYHEFENVPLDTMLVNLPLSADSMHLLELVDAKDVKTGAVVARLPFAKNSFVALEEVAEDSILKKYGCFTLFCLALGAKRISVSHMQASDVLSESTAKKSAAIQASGGVYSGSAKAEDSVAGELSEKFSNVLKMTTQGTGGDPDFSTAERMVADYGIKNDDLFIPLLERRRLLNNGILKQTLLLDTMKELQSLYNHETMLRLEFMAPMCKGMGAVNVAANIKQRKALAVSLQIEVEF